MCVSDTSGRSRKGVFTRANGETPAVVDEQTKGDRPIRGADSEERSIAVRALSALVWLYQRLISPWIGPRCRFLPTCSDYALDALAQHGAIRGGWLTVRRLLRCHPLGASGFDPVPAVLATPKPRSEATVHRAASAGASSPQARA